jgi:hypothetical protein
MDEAPNAELPLVSTTRIDIFKLCRLSKHKKSSLIKPYMYIESKIRKSTSKDLYVLHYWPVQVLVFGPRRALS